MNLKQAKRLRAYLRDEFGISVRNVAYVVFANREYRLDPDCGRGLYQRMKRHG